MEELLATDSHIPRCLSISDVGLDRSCLALGIQQLYPSTSTHMRDSIILAFFVVAQCIEARGWRCRSGGVNGRRHGWHLMDLLWGLKDAVRVDALDEEDSSGRFKSFCVLFAGPWHVTASVVVRS